MLSQSFETTQYLSQLIRHITNTPKYPEKMISLLKNYKGSDWAHYIQYQSLYPHEIKLWKNNAHDLSIISLYPQQSYTIYKNSTVCLLTGIIQSKHQPYVVDDCYITKNKLTFTSSNDYTSFFVFKNYKDML